MANNIVEFNIDGTSYTQRPYGTCSTAAGTAAKVVTCSGFNLVTGATVMVKFTNANTVANPTLNVNSKGAKAIYYRGAALTASSLANWGAGDVVEFRYNGTQWDLLNVGNTTTGEANVQSDWNVTDTNSDAYIKNKPTIPTAVTSSTVSGWGFTKNAGTVTKVSTGAGLTGGDITSSGTIKCKLNSETSLGTIGTTSKLYAVGVDANGKLCVPVPWTDTGTVTSITPGTGLTGTSSDTAITSSGTINLKVASSSEIGGIKIGYTESGKNYPVELDSNNKAYVNVPWTGEANVQSDWNVTDTTSDAYIKNKPTITDTKVTQTVTTSNANYPILLAPSTQTTTTTGAAYFETAIKINPSTRKITGVDYISSDSTDLHIQCDEWLILDGGGDGCGIRPNSSSINDCDLGTTSIRFRDGFFSNKVYAANGFYESSDERLKDFGEGLRVDLDALSKLRKSYFTFKDKPENPQIGVSAQEIQKLYPEVVIETSDGHLNVDYAKLSVVALAAIDQLNDKVKSLEDRLARLEKLLENK